MPELIHRAILATVVLLLSSLSGAHAQRPNETNCRIYHERHLPIIRVIGKGGMVLFDSSSEDRKKLGYLLIYDDGKPAIYPSPIVNAATHSSNGLQYLLLEQIEQLWLPKKNQSANYEIDCYGWCSDKRQWGKFHVTLRFDGECSCFKVSGPGIADSSWQSSETIPNEVVKDKTAINTPGLPPWAYCDIDGPRDSDAAVHGFYVP